MSEKNLRSADGIFRVHLHDDDSIDEIFARDVSIHIEQMDDNCFWMGVYRMGPDGREKETLHINFHSRGHIYVTAESDCGTLAAGWKKHKPKGVPIEPSTPTPEPRHDD